LVGQWGATLDACEQNLQLFASFTLTNWSASLSLDHPGHSVFFQLRDDSCKEGSKVRIKAWQGSNSGVVPKKEVQQRPKRSRHTTCYSCRISTILVTEVNLALLPVDTRSVRNSEDRIIVRGPSVRVAQGIVIPSVHVCRTIVERCVDGEKP